MRVVAPLTLPDGMWTKGGYAEYALISESDMVSLPEAVSSQAAVALLSQGLAAALMVREAGSLAGTSVLVHSAGSGIGSIVVQLARIGGARKVIGLASSAERRQHILDIGADLALDSSAKTWPSEVLTATGGAGASLIFDGSGGEGGRHNLECIAEFGRLVIYGSSSGSYAEFSQQEWLQLLLKNASITGFGRQPSTTSLQHSSNWFRTESSNWLPRNFHSKRPPKRIVLWKNGVQLVRLFWSPRNSAVMLSMEHPSIASALLLSSRR
jgi:NADPH2:quinone reductase